MGFNSPQRRMKGHRGGITRSQPDNGRRDWTNSQPVLRNPPIQHFGSLEGKSFVQEARDTERALTQSPSSNTQSFLFQDVAEAHYGRPERKSDSLTIRASYKPKLSTYDIHNVFTKFGTVEYIEIYEVHIRQSHGAKIRFRPVPQRPFWTSQTFQARVLPAARPTDFYIRVEPMLSTPTVMSPINADKVYPQYLEMEALSLEFGILYEANSMMVMQKTAESQDMSISIRMNLQRKVMDVFFDIKVLDPRSASTRLAPLPLDLNRRHEVGVLNRKERYRFQIPLDSLKTIRKISNGDDTDGLLISLPTPPLFFRKAVGEALARSHHAKANFWTDWDTWYRQTDIVYEPNELRDVPLSLRKKKPTIDIGRWTTYLFTFSRKLAQFNRFALFLDALQDHNVQVEPLEDFKTIGDREATVWNSIDIPKDARTSHKSTALQQLTEHVKKDLEFQVRYQLEVCISQGFMSEHNLTAEFVERLCGLDQRKAVTLLEHVSNSKSRIYDPMEIFTMRPTAASTTQMKIPHYCIRMRRATVTPSMIYFGTPTVETSNRVLRQYSEHEDRFLRITFTDEQLRGRIHFTEKEAYSEVFTRIKRALRHGITVGDRHFEFLAFGNSQFREHGAYFFAPTLHLSIANIRSWMGDFRDIRVPAKYAARIGQCFSTTRAIRGSTVDVRTLSDIEKIMPSGKVYKFTDGVGKISKFLAQVISSELGLQFVPSVFQFRLGGCKGVLAVWPDVAQKDIHVRRSQYKFAAIHNGLEIIRWSQYASASLNRQIIMVLSTLGVPNEIFVQKLKDMLANLSLALTDERTALKLLQKYVDPNQVTLEVASMISSGFQRIKEPFMISILKLWRAWSMKYLKEHAKIVIEQGAFVLGCVDEAGVLKGHEEDLTQEGRQDMLPEIFIQVPDPSKEGKYKVIEDVCLLARNPSLHPGDIRLVRAVSRPELLHLQDVVVLPSVGERDLAGMCSGGDLDGDDYLIIWDKDLRPPKFNYAPMDFTPPKIEELDRPVSENDVMDFFVQYMKNDSLGSIAHAHLAHADMSESGVMDKKCYDLARLHSLAVDYAKTGSPAYLPHHMRPRRYPHYMEKAKEKTYNSKSVLGLLYDQVERIDFRPEYDTAFDQRILNAFPLSQDDLQEMSKVKSKYDNDMRRIMAQHDIHTEFEVWSTFVLHHSGQGSDYKFHEEIGRVSSALKDQYRERCIEKAGGRGFDKLAKTAAAAYTVTNQQIQTALAENKEKASREHESSESDSKFMRSMPLMSFPWCMHSELSRIARMPTATTQLATYSPPLASPTPPTTHRKVLNPENDSTATDDVHTAQGITHRGEVLELFDSIEETRGQPQTPALAMNVLTPLSQPNSAGTKTDQRSNNNNATGAMQTENLPSANVENEPDAQEEEIKDEVVDLNAQGRSALDAFANF